jgi:hypothetical protein
VIDIVLNNYVKLTFGLEFSAAITGLILYKKYKSTVAKYFIFFLVCIVVLDFMSGYTQYVQEDKFLSFLKGTRFQKNHWFTTIYWFIGAIMFFSFYYVKILKTVIFKTIIKVISFGFLVISIIYIALNWELFFIKFFPFLDIFGAIIILMCSMFYFFEVLQSNKILNFYKSLNFYISFTIFFWWLIITPLTFYEVYFSSQAGNPTRDMNYVVLRNYIFLFVNLFMYSTFTFALIWCKPEND